MSETPKSDETPIGGQRYLWSRPELLTPEEHGELGLSPCDAPFSFTATSRGIPLTMTEFQSAQRDYPVVFTDHDNPVPLAAVGLQEERNLFLDADGRWESGVYLPAYLRCHPFALAKADNDRFAVVVDRDAPAVTENPQTPFFVDGQLSQPVRQAVEFCQAYDAETERTREFCARLKELELLVPQRMRQEGSEEDLVRYYAVSQEKLNALETAEVDRLYRSGHLAAIFAHLFSLDLWNELLRRQMAAPVRD